MKKIFNAYLLNAATVFLTIGPLSNLWANQKTAELKCPEFQTAEEALNFFVEADKVGARLSTDSANKLKSCISFDDENAWDLFQVVGAHEIKECAGGKKNSEKKCLEIKYGSYGKLFSATPFKKNKDIEFVTQKIEAVKKGPTWHLSGLRQIPPMLSKNGAMYYLQTIHDKDNTPQKNDWIKTASAVIETLK